MKINSEQEIKDFIDLIKTLKASTQALQSSFTTVALATIVSGRTDALDQLERAMRRLRAAEFALKQIISKENVKLKIAQNHEDN